MPSVWDMGVSPQDQYVSDFARSNGVPYASLLTSDASQSGGAALPPTINDLYADDGSQLPDSPFPDEPMLAGAARQSRAPSPTASSGAQKEVQSKSALDDLMAQLASHRTADAENDRHQMWANFFSNLAANKSPSLGGAIADASSTLGPSMQQQDIANRARADAALRDQIGVEKFKEEQALKQSAQDQEAPLRAAQANYYNSRADRVGTGTGGGSVAQWKYNTWLAAHPDDTEGALQYVAGHKTMDDSLINKNALGMAAKDTMGIDPDGTMVPEEKVAAYKSLLKQGTLPPSVVKAKPKGFFDGLFGGSSAPAADAMVSVVSPDGTPGSIPASQLAGAKAAGYKER